MKIEFANWCKQHELATKQKGKFSVYVGNSLNMHCPKDVLIWEFITKSLINLYGERSEAYYDVIGGVIESGLFFFENGDQAWEFYSIFTQELTDSSAVYACLYCPVAGCLTENT
jgi:hypothetical protein